MRGPVMNSVLIKVISTIDSAYLEYNPIDNCIEGVVVVVQNHKHYNIPMNTNTRLIMIAVYF